MQEADDDACCIGIYVFVHVEFESDVKNLSGSFFGGVLIARKIARIYRYSGNKPLWVLNIPYKADWHLIRLRKKEGIKREC